MTNIVIKYQRRIKEKRGKNRINKATLNIRLTVRESGFIVLIRTKSKIEGFRKTAVIIIHYKGTTPLK